VATSFAYPVARPPIRLPALARLGGDVELVVAVGDDDHGRFLRREWADRGVRTSFVQSSQRPTGVALIPVSDDGENMIVVASGANRDLAVDDVPLEEFEVVVTQLETSLDVLDELLARSRRVVLNVAPARQLPTALVARAALVVANEIEVRSARAR
jgi:ribokinase